MATEHEEKLGTEDSKWLGEYSQVHMNVFGTPLRVMDHGQGAHIWDVDGNEYLDFLAGIAVNSLGYATPSGSRRLPIRLPRWLISATISRPSRKLNWHPNWSSWLVHLKAPKSTSATPVLKAMKLPSSLPSCMAAPCLVPCFHRRQARTHSRNDSRLPWPYDGCAVRHMETRYPQAV